MPNRLDDSAGDIYYGVYEEEKAMIAEDVIYEWGNSNCPHHNTTETTGGVYCADCQTWFIYVTGADTTADVKYEDINDVVDKMFKNRKIGRTNI